MHYSRSDWGARPARSGPGALIASRVEGIALHWPALQQQLRGVPAVMTALRGWQDYHMDGHGWSDIAYQVAIDQDGNTYTLRGLTTQSAANGDQDVNERFGALLLIVAPGERPTTAMVASVRRVIAHHRELYPQSTRIVGHGQIRPEPTACPGPIVQELIDQHVFSRQKGVPQLQPTRGELVDAAIKRLREAYGNAQPGGARAAKIKAAIDQLLKLRPWKRGQAGELNPTIAILGAIVGLVAIACVLLGSLAIGGKLDDSSTPLVVSVFGVIGTTVTALLSLLALLYAQKASSTADKLANGGGKEAARQGTHQALAEAAADPEGPIVTDPAQLRRVIAEARTEKRGGRVW
jgi:hypothetical protein